MEERVKYVRGVSSIAGDKDAIKTTRSGGGFALKIFRKREI